MFQFFSMCHEDEEEEEETLTAQNNSLFNISHCCFHSHELEFLGDLKGEDEVVSVMQDEPLDFSWLFRVKFLQLFTLYSSSWGDEELLINHRGGSCRCPWRLATINQRLAGEVGKHFRVCYFWGSDKSQNQLFSVCLKRRTEEVIKGHKLKKTSRKCSGKD